MDEQGKGMIHMFKYKVFDIEEDLHIVQDVLFDCLASLAFWVV